MSDALLEQVIADRDRRLLEIEQLRARLRISIGLLKRFTTADQSNMPHFLASDVELFLRGIGGEDE